MSSNRLTSAEVLHNKDRAPDTGAYEFGLLPTGHLVSTDVYGTKHVTVHLGWVGPEVPGFDQERELKVSHLRRLATHDSLAFQELEAMGERITK